MTDETKPKREWKEYPPYERTGVIHGNYGSTEKWRTQRRAILTEVINSDPTKHWSMRDLEEAMRAHPLIQQVQPRLGKSTIHLDWLAVKNELAEKRKELAGEYIDHHLQISEYFIQDMMEEYEKINSINVDDISDPDIRAQVILSRMAEKDRIIKAVDRMMKRQSTLVPIDVPKKLEIDDQKRITFNVERFLDMNKQAEQFLGDGIEEGEYVDADDD